jgi:hypothetical protein
MKKKTRTKRKASDTRSASKPTTPLNRVRGVIGSKEDWGALRRALDSVKNDGPAKDFQRLYGLSTISEVSAIAFPAGKTIKQPNRIQAVRPLDAAGILKEIAWVVTVLSRITKQINMFVIYREEYFLALLQGNYQTAGEVLDALEKNCGASLWVIENRIALLAINGGFETQKLYVNNLIGSHKRSFVAFFAGNVSERNETRVTKSSYEGRLKERVKSWDLESDKLTYILYKLVGIEDLTTRQACDILAFEAASSGIDLYQTFIDILATVRDATNGSRKKISNELDRLIEIKDFQC